MLKGFAFGHLLIRLFHFVANVLKSYGDLRIAIPHFFLLKRVEKRPYTLLELNSLIRYDHIQLYKSYLNLLKVAWYGLSLCMSPRFYLIPICKMELESKGLIHLIMPSTLNNMSKQNPDLVILNQPFIGVQRYEVH